MSPYRLQVFVRPWVCYDGSAIYGYLLLAKFVTSVLSNHQPPFKIFSLVDSFAHQMSSIFRHSIFYQLNELRLTFDVERNLLHFPPVLNRL